MSLTTRYYEFCYGSLLPECEQELSEYQWRLLTYSATQLQGWRRQLIPAAPFVAIVLCPAAGVFDLFLVVGAQAVPPWIWWPLFFACVSSASVALRVWLLRPFIRRTAAQLGYVRLCPECEYSLKGLPEDTRQCPECGAAIPSRAAEEMTAS